MGTFLAVTVLLAPASCMGNGGAPRGTRSVSAESHGRDAGGVAADSTSRTGSTADSAEGSRWRAPAPKQPVAWRRNLLKDRVVVKFVDQVPVRLRAGKLVAAGRSLAEVESVLARYPDARLMRLHSVDESVLDARRQSGQARSGKPLADLNNYYLLRFAAPTDRAVELANALLWLDLVETAYLEPVATTPGPPGGSPEPTGPRGGRVEPRTRAGNETFAALAAKPVSLPSFEAIPSPLRGDDPCSSDEC